MYDKNGLGHNDHPVFNYQVHWIYLKFIVLEIKKQYSVGL